MKLMVFMRHGWRLEMMKNKNLLVVEEDGDEIFWMPPHCQKWPCYKNKFPLVNKNGNACCTECGASYGPVEIPELPNLDDDQLYWNDEPVTWDEFCDRLEGKLNGP